MAFCKSCCRIVFVSILIFFAADLLFDLGGPFSRYKSHYEYVKRMNESVRYSGCGVERLDKRDMTPQQKECVARWLVLERMKDEELLDLLENNRKQ